MVQEAVLLLLVTFTFDLISVTFVHVTVGFGYPWFVETPVLFPATGYGGVTDGGEYEADAEVDAEDDDGFDDDDIESDSESGAVPSVELIAVGVEIVVDVFKKGNSRLKIRPQTVDKRVARTIE